MMKDYLNSHCLAELRNGDLRIVVKVGNSGAKILVDPVLPRWNYLSHWSEDGKVVPMMNRGAYEGDLEPKKHDIVKVWGRITGTANYDSALQASTEYRRLLWQCREAKKLTVKEIEALLGYDIEIVGEPV